MKRNEKSVPGPSPQDGGTRGEVKVVGRTDDLRISAIRALIPPQLLLEELPIDAAALATVSAARGAIHSRATNHARASAPTLKRVSPGTRIHTSMSMIGRCMNSAERAYQ